MRLLKALHLVRRETPPVPVDKEPRTRHVWRRAAEEDRMIAEWNAFMDRVHPEGEEGDGTT